MITADIDHISPEIVVQIVEDCRAEALRHLADLIPPGAASLMTCQAVDGEPATEIVRAALRLESDLIIMGRRRRRGLKRLLSRCVAREVIRRAP
jgi:nucleotide-binding universal stress UspA family protein